MADNITFTIEEHIANIAPTSDNGWTRELNRVSWNGGNAKYDIREWAPEHDRMSRGITLTDAEMQAVVEAVAGRF